VVRSTENNVCEFYPEERMSEMFRGVKGPLDIKVLSLKDGSRSRPF
jgi:hypothetical protein